MSFYHFPNLPVREELKKNWEKSMVFCQTWEGDCFFEKGFFREYLESFWDPQN